MMEIFFLSISLEVRKSKGLALEFDQSIRTRANKKIFTIHHIYNINLYALTHGIKELNI